MNDTDVEYTTCLDKEIYNVGDSDNINYPSDTVNINDSHYRPADIHDFCGDGPQAGHTVADYFHLFPPVIFNFRADAKEDGNKRKRSKLSGEELNYFQANGNNATIFIHGFNVKYGNYSKQIETIEKNAPAAPIMQPWQMTEFGPPPEVTPEFIVTPGASDRTIFCNPEVLNQQFGVLEPVPDYEAWREMQKVPSKRLPYNHLPDELWQDEKLNGEEAFNWFLHMEDNLNTATGQFTRNAGLPPTSFGQDHTKSPYYKYTRLINIAWSGDVEPLNYLDAVDNSKKAGERLALVVIQLIQKGIKVNIMAHSLGNGVLVSCLETLVQKGYEEKVAHAFLWEAALPDNIFASPPEPGTNPRYQFPNAHKGAQKFTVLYSAHDNILGPLPPHAELSEKLSDPSGGFSTMLQESLSLMDKLNLPNHVSSVYNVANMLGEPWSYYLDHEKGEAHRNEFYTTWTRIHPMNTKGELFSLTLALEMAEMFKRYPVYYVALTTGIDASNGSNEGSSYLSSLSILRVNKNFEEWINPTVGPIQNEGSQQAQETATIILTILTSRGAEPRPALGYSGPDLTDITTGKLYKEGKIIRADQQDYLKTHSGMRIPSKDMMEHVYKRWIINKDQPEVGMHPFGRYD